MALTIGVDINCTNYLVEGYIYLTNSFGKAAYPGIILSNGMGLFDKLTFSIAVMQIALGLPDVLVVDSYLRRRVTVAPLNTKHIIPELANPRACGWESADFGNVVASAWYISGKRSDIREIMLHIRLSLTTTQYAFARRYLSLTTYRCLLPQPPPQFEFIPLISILYLWSFYDISTLSLVVQTLDSLLEQSGFSMMFKSPPHPGRWGPLLLMACFATLTCILAVWWCMDNSDRVPLQFGFFIGDRIPLLDIPIMLYKKRRPSEAHVGAPAVPHKEVCSTKIAAGSSVSFGGLITARLHDGTYRFVQFLVGLHRTLGFNGLVHILAKKTGQDELVTLHAHLP
ncbi:hypothetical protein DFH29DRAFT_873413 [Suillus ampliporus]|nr:hypothetical protein DFH29DRAFT_873413 [Suillus ampliporus]